MKRNGDAFTLIEMLVVVAIIMILMGLLFPAFSYARQIAKKTKAKSDVKQLDIAWKGVLSDYRTWGEAKKFPPVLQSAAMGAAEDMTVSLVSYLQGANSKGITYMEFDASSTNAIGMIDPWYNSQYAPASSQNATRYYQVALGQNSVNPPAYKQINRSVAAWSRGLDGKNGTPQERLDDVKSWE